MPVKIPTLKTIIENRNTKPTEAHSCLVSGRDAHFTYLHTLMVVNPA